MMIITEEEIEEEMMIPMPGDLMLVTGDLDHLHHPEMMTEEIDTMAGTAMTEIEIIEEEEEDFQTMSQQEKETGVVMGAFPVVKIVMGDMIEMIAEKGKLRKKDQNLIWPQGAKLLKKKVLELSQAYLEVLNLLTLSRGKKKWKRDFRKRKRRKRRL